MLHQLLQYLKTIPYTNQKPNDEKNIFFTFSFNSNFKFIRSKRASRYSILENNDLNRDTEYFWEKEFEEDKPLSLTQNNFFYKTLIFIDEKNATISENFPIEDISLSKEETQHLDLRYSRFRYKTDHHEYTVKQKYKGKERFIVLIEKTNKKQLIFKVKADENDYEIYSLTEIISKEKFRKYIPRTAKWSRD